MPEPLLNVPAILERGVSDVASVFDAFDVGVYCVDAAGFFTYVNPAALEMLGWTADELLGRRAHDAIHHSRPDGSPLPLEECPFFGALRRRAAERVLEDVFWANGGSRIEVAHAIAPLYEDGRHVGAIVIFNDIGERRRNSELLRRRAAQQSGLAELGLLALGGADIQALLEQATSLVARTLAVELAHALELDAPADRLRLRAALGLPTGLIGTATVEAGRGSLAGYTVMRDKPVVVEDLRREQRFRPPAFLLENGVVSGLTVVIPGRGGTGGTAAWGVLGAHARGPRTFTSEDIDFLHTVANTLGLAIKRNDAEQQLRERNREIADLAEEVSRLADERRRIMADALDAEGRTREQIAQLLHDEVLQSLLAIRQDMAKLKHGGDEEGEVVSQAKEAIIGAIRELRGAVLALHPVTLEQGGLASALRAIADLHAGRGGFEVALKVEPQANGMRDQLIVSLAQELLSNVARHAHARHVVVTLRRADETLVFEVTDDGRGMAATRPRQAFEQGHVGLASAALRVESLGGSFELVSRSGRGSRVRAAIPVGIPDLGGRSSRS